MYASVIIFVFERESELFLPEINNLSRVKIPIHSPSAEKQTFALLGAEQLSFAAVYFFKQIFKGYAADQCLRSI